MQLQVVAAKDGAEALEILNKQEFDLVITDINMPKMNGYELCAAIKSGPKNKTPVILCTSLASPEDLIRGIEAGADNYIIKPYQEDHIITAVTDLLKAIPPAALSLTKEQVIIRDQKYLISATRQCILNFLFTTYQNVHQQNQELIQLREDLEKAIDQIKSIQKEQEKVLLNIFPEKVVQELIAYDSVNPQKYDDASVMFLDFVGFTKSSKDLTPQTLVEALNFYFENFDTIIERHRLERIKTLGDGYMCAGGLPEANQTHALDCAYAALEILEFVKSHEEEVKKKYNVSWQIRIGINSGPLVAGVIGKKRFAYDIWGDTVNLASRMESHCEPDKINVSASTYAKIKEVCECVPRGNVPVRNKEGVEQFVEMYFVLGTVKK
jgi:class 3 adenylate cyclase/CheY-like chemotaxis protein